jgi:pyruvate formate lyase activating enzyme
MKDPPNTTVETLIRAAEVGQEAGLHYVYAGNLPGHVGPNENTFCPECNETLIERKGYLILGYHLTSDKACPRCGTKIAGVWPEDKSAVRTGNAFDYFTRRPRLVNW